MGRLFLCTLTIKLILIFCAPSHGQSGQAILSVSGNIAAGQIDLTRDDLERLPQSQIRTGTPWHKGIVTFEGPRLSDLMKMVGASGETVEVIALNDYSASLPFSDFDAFNPILALKENGQFMTVQSKGPLFVVYPFDDRPELKTKLYFARSVWLVRALKIN
ncbi:molybdopterin-dependent oxidoreductase [Roseibium aggregatum]|uniref:Molybdopterin-dependent oxidoreductase n=1 Tax=Roseibium aggregatum TaxID=187304 RepID=A0A939J5D0_9HYPH|nr:molybdopterin-dependent oxidoreductase [Roseibium aggregatum]MBN9672120.1 molybdopterin-dependent oxidoreductase [Roseibium aggregatum]